MVPGRSVFISNGRGVSKSSSSHADSLGSVSLQYNKLEEGCRAWEEPEWAEAFRLFNDCVGAGYGQGASERGKKEG